LVVAAMLLPIVLLAVVHTAATVEEIRFTSKHEGAVEYLADIRNLMQAIATHRAEANKAITGSTEAATALAAARDKGNQAIARMRARIADDDDRYALASEIYSVARLWQALENSWRNDT